MPSSFLRTTRASVVRSYRCRGRYLPATSWKLVRFGFPGSYIANLVGSRDRRNDRFDRSWIFARCFAVVPIPRSSRPRRRSLARCVPFPFFFISTYVFRAACFYRHEWDFMTSRHPAVPLSASPPLRRLRTLVVLRFLPGSDFISGRTRDRDNHPESREDFFDRETTPFWLPNFCWFARIQILLYGNACSARVESLCLTPRPLVFTTEKSRNNNGLVPDRIIRSNCFVTHWFLSTLSFYNVYVVDIRAVEEKERDLQSIF